MSSRTAWTKGSTAGGGLGGISGTIAPALADGAAGSTSAAATRLPELEAGGAAIADPMGASAGTAAACVVAGALAARAVTDVVSASRTTGGAPIVVGSSWIAGAAGTGAGAAIGRDPRAAFATEVGGRSSAAGEIACIVAEVRVGRAVRSPTATPNVAASTTPATLPPTARSLDDRLGAWVACPRNRAACSTGAGTGKRIEEATTGAIVG
jgi:hypothetical protein